MKVNRRKQVLLHIIGIAMVLIIVFPVYVLVITSLKPLKDVFDMKLIPSISTMSFNNYIEVLRDLSLGRPFLNSFIIAVSVTSFGLVFHSMGGYAIARLYFPGKQLIFRCILSTMMIPITVTIIPLFIIVRTLGLLNSLQGLIIPCIPSAFGLFMFRQFYLGLPKELEESAKMDGASFFGSYFRIALPLSKAIIITLSVMTFFASWNSYLWPLIITQRKQLWTIQLAIANLKNQFEAIQTPWNLILAASCMAAIPTIFMFFIFQRYLVDGIKMSGLKA